MILHLTSLTSCPLAAGHAPSCPTSRPVPMGLSPSGTAIPERWPESARKAARLNPRSPPASGNTVRHVSWRSEDGPNNDAVDDHGIDFFEGIPSCSSLVLEDSADEILCFASAPCFRFGNDNSHFLSVSMPTIRKIPRSLYAKKYRIGDQATTGQGPAVLKLCTCSPVSTCLTSRPEPAQRLLTIFHGIWRSGDFLPSSLPPTT